MIIAPLNQRRAAERPDRRRCKRDRDCLCRLRLNATSESLRQRRIIGDHCQRYGVRTLDIRPHFSYIPHESNLALRDAVRVMPGGRGGCGARGRGLISFALGRSGHHACRHYDRRARCVAGSGKAVGGVTPAPWTVLPTKPGPDRTKGLHTPWAEPWWNAGRRARPRAERAAQAAFPWRDRTPFACGTDDSAFAGVPLPFISFVIARSGSEAKQSRTDLGFSLELDCFAPLVNGLRTLFDIAV